MITLNERIFLRMKELGVRSRDLCQKLEINEHNFSPFINGKRPIPYVDLERICVYLGLTLVENKGTTL